MMKPQISALLLPPGFIPSLEKVHSIFESLGFQTSAVANIRRAANATQGSFVIRTKLKAISTKQLQSLVKMFSVENIDVVSTSNGILLVFNM